MPELPDVEVYREALAARITGATLARVEVRNPFVLRTADPPLAAAEGRQVVGVRRLGKRLVVVLAGELCLVLHMMIAGRLQWLAIGGKAPPARITLAVLHFSTGRLAFTEAGTKRRASLHVVAGEGALAAFDAGGLDVRHLDAAGFAERLKRENHTLKRALTDPRMFSGIGNAYSDEILHRARLSPLALTAKLGDDEIARLHRAACDVLDEWTARLREEASGSFPARVTAFHPRMAVHGRYGQPCPVCGTKVQRIVYSENECNYCPRCQTGGRLLADRSLSRLLHASWPKAIDEG